MSDSENEEVVKREIQCCNISSTNRVEVPGSVDENRVETEDSGEEHHAISSGECEVSTSGSVNTNQHPVAQENLSQFEENVAVKRKRPKFIRKDDMMRDAHKRLEKAQDLAKHILTRQKYQESSPSQNNAVPATISIEAQLDNPGDRLSNHKYQHEMKKRQLLIKQDLHKFYNPRPLSRKKQLPIIECQLVPVNLGKEHKRELSAMRSDVIERKLGRSQCQARYFSCELPTGISTNASSSNSQNESNQDRNRDQVPTKFDLKCQCTHCLINNRHVSQMQQYRPINRDSTVDPNQKPIYVKVRMTVEGSLYVLKPTHNYAFTVIKRTADRVDLKCYIQDCECKAYLQKGKYYLRLGDVHTHRPTTIDVEKKIKAHKREIARTAKRQKAEEKKTKIISKEEELKMLLEERDRLLKSIEELKRKMSGNVKVEKN